MKRLIFVVAATSCALFVAAPAFGHAAYESSDPPDGGQVASPPSEVTANYTEPLAEGGSWMDVTDPCGRDVGGETSISGDSMTVHMSGAAKGEYVVRWQAASAIDPHVTRGEFAFTSTGGQPCPGVDEPEKEEPLPSNGSKDTSSESGGAGSGDQISSSSSSGGNDGSGGGRNDTSQRANGGGGDRPAADSGAGSQALAQAPSEEEERDRSALDGIPVGGLVLTLVLSAFIGAAAGKIYFSLSREAD